VRACALHALADMSLSNAEHWGGGGEERGRTKGDVNLWGS
jgi:hypothetical protein